MYIDGINMLDIEACYARRFKEMIPAYVNILKSNNNNNRFLVTEAASLMNRILIVGYQRIGCKVFGFHHGGDFAATITNQTHKGAMSHCKNLIVPNKGIADQYKKTYSQLKLESIVGTKYQSLTNKKLFFKDKEKLGLDRDIKNVMLMGFPMSCQRRLGERGLFFLSKIEIEYKIMEMLKKIGLNVLYKAHPDRGNEVNGIFDGIADRIVYDTFEKSWEMADAFIFTYTSTTTFDLALKTDKKIILIDVKTNLVDECLRLNLHKRVDYVPATINSNDFLINFDKNILKNCVFDNHTTHNDV